MDNHYYGGKSGDGHFHQIINRIPPHTTYFELFGGKVGIFRHKKPSYRTFIIERDATLEAYYTKLGIKRCFDIVDFNNRIYRTGPGAFYFIEDALEYINDYAELLDRNNYNFIYLDPPYPLTSRRDSRPSYKYELSDQEHLALLNNIREYTCAKIAISTYKNEIYDDRLFEHWEVAEISAQTRHGRVTEQLWMNYPALTELHDYRYLGSNYREREDITRMQRRWVTNFKRLPILEQKAMLELLTAATAVNAESGQGNKRKKKKPDELIYLLS